MSSVSVWVLTVLGIIILSILVDLILPGGSTSGFIKNIFGYLIIIVILSPVFTFLTQKEFDFNNIFKTSAIEIQDNFVSNVNRQMLNSIEQNIENDCKDGGLLGVKVGIQADIFSNKVEIKQVNIDLSKLVISENNENINIKTSIINIVQKNIVIEKELIVFYE